MRLRSLLCIGQDVALAHGEPFCWISFEDNLSRILRHQGVAVAAEIFRACADAADGHVAVSIYVDTFAMFCGVI